MTNMDFREWIGEVHHLWGAEGYTSGPDEESWKESYFDEGYSPADAVSDEIDALGRNS